MFKGTFHDGSGQHQYQLEFIFTVFSTGSVERNRNLKTKKLKFEFVTIAQGGAVQKHSKASNHIRVVSV